MQKEGGQLDLRGRDSEALGELPPARVLLLAHNRLQALDLGQQKALVRLEAANNLLRELQLPLSPQALRTVDLSFNRLSGIGRSVLPNLKTLRLAHNCFESLDFLHLLPRARLLDLSHNQLQRAAAPAAPLSLQTLLLGHNQLPDTRWLAGSAFPRLLELDLSANGLQQAALGALPALTSLDLSHNRLTGLQGLSELRALEVLGLEHNLIEDARALQVVEQMEELVEVRVAGNPCAHESIHELLMEFAPSLQSVDGFELGQSAEEDEEVAELRKKALALRLETDSGAPSSLQTSLDSFQQQLAEMDVRITSESARMDRLIRDFDPLPKETAVSRAQLFLQSLDSPQPAEAAPAPPPARVPTPAFKIKSLRKALCPVRSIADLKRQNALLRRALSPPTQSLKP